DSIAHHTGRKLNIWIFGVMAVAMVLLLTNTFVLHRRVNEVAAAPATAPVIAPPSSIAVLPFSNESDDNQQDYFADGIAEDLLNLLTEVRKLHVANVLEGSVRKAGDELRITAQLVRASDGYQIWSHSYDRQLTDIFAIQDGIAADVVKNLKVKLLGALPTARATDPKAYTLYLQARQLANQSTADSFKSSNALLQQALAIDPRYAPAWKELARNFGNEATFGMFPADQGWRQARDAADEALAIDPDYAPAQATLGVIAMNQNNDLPDATRHFERALALDPTDLSVLSNSAGLLLALGRLPSGIAVMEYGVARDP